MLQEHSRLNKAFLVLIKKKEISDPHFIIHYTTWQNINARTCMGVCRCFGKSKYQAAIKNMFDSSQITCISQEQAGRWAGAKRKFRFLKNYLKIRLDFCILIQFVLVVYSLCVNRNSVISLLPGHLSKLRIFLSIGQRAGAADTNRTKVLFNLVYQMKSSFETKKAVLRFDIAQLVDCFLFRKPKLLYNS